MPDLIHQNAFSFYWYTEADILLPEQHFSFYLERQAELWHPHRWLFQFQVRACMGFAIEAS
jgi:transposase